jgi:uncharacterized OB-fold protein
MAEHPARITPPLNDLNRPFWTGGAAGALKVTRCAACERWVFPLSATCPDCGGPTTYEQTSGRGNVFTYTTNEHPYNPAVPLPYNIAIVELVEQEGLRFTTNVVDCPPEDVRIGLPVHVVFEQHGEVFVPLFAPDREDWAPVHPRPVAR